MSHMLCFDWLSQFPFRFYLQTGIVHFVVVVANCNSQTMNVCGHFLLYAHQHFIDVSRGERANQSNYKQNNHRHHLFQGSLVRLLRLKQMIFFGFGKPGSKHCQNLASVEQCWCLL